MSKKRIIIVIIGLSLVGIYFIWSILRSLNTEVIDTFGVRNEKLEKSKEATNEKNYVLQKSLIENLDAQSKLRIQAIDSISNNLYKVVESLKTELTISLKGSSDDEAMDTDNRLLFENNAEKGHKLVYEITIYRSGLTRFLDSDLPEIISEINTKFDTSPVINGEGKEIEWLAYHFKGFPLVTVLTKLTQLQVDLESIKSHTYKSIANLN
jgi:hypothetical protein